MLKSQRSSAAAAHPTSSLLLRDLFDASLSQFISEAANGCSETLVSAAAAEANAPPNSYLIGKSSVVEDISRCKDIFLSGVTGFLGCHLLQDLIYNSSANIHCLVRVSSSSQSDAQHRLDSCLRKYNVSLTREQLSRIIVHEGDLTLPLFGLPEDRFLQLSDCVDAVVHNGAHVNWLMTYAQLRPANVMVCCAFCTFGVSFMLLIAFLDCRIFLILLQGTATALHLALIGKRKCFVHISTLRLNLNSFDAA